MSRKTLRINRFGDSILGEIESFTFFVKEIIINSRNPDFCCLRFNWNWNGYNGYGEIDFCQSTSKLCTGQGNNFSHMTIHSLSKRKQAQGRDDCALYNDPSLEKLFEMILSKSNLTPTE